MAKGTAVTVSGLVHGDARHMREVRNNSVQLVVTSPPYNVGKPYGTHNDTLAWREYMTLLRQVWVECRRVLVKGGRLAIVVADTGRAPYIPLHAHITLQAIALGFNMRGTIIWDKGASAGRTTRWGSWRRATNPTMRDVHEYILVFCKSAYALQPPHTVATKGETIDRDEFLTSTLSVWHIPTEQVSIKIDGKRVKHPAPFPRPLARKLINLYTNAGDLVCDPFCGSGTSWIEAELAERRFVGYEIDATFAHLARARHRVEVTEVLGQAALPMP